MLTTPMPIPLGHSGYLRPEPFTPVAAATPIRVDGVAALLGSLSNRVTRSEFRSASWQVASEVYQQERRRSREPSQTDYDARKVRDLLSGVRPRWPNNTGGNPLNRAVTPLLTFSPRGCSGNRSRVLCARARLRPREPEGRRNDRNRGGKRVGPKPLDPLLSVYSSISRERSRKSVRQRGQRERETGRGRGREGRLGESNLTFAVPASIYLRK